MPLSTWLNTAGLRTAGLRTAARRLLILRLDPWHLVRDIGYRRQNLNLYCAGFLRSLGVGLLGVILAVYLSRAGVGTTSIGVVIGVGLFGACAATAWVTWAGARLGCRNTLVTLSLLATVGGLALAVLPAYPVLLILVFVGMVNGMGTDRSAAFALEQAIIPGLVPARSRTWGLSWHNVLLDSGGALGALGAGVPLTVNTWSDIGLIQAYRYLFVGYAFLHCAIDFGLLCPGDRTEGTVA